MKAPVLSVLCGFTVALVVTPDPTGVLPVLVGIVLTGLLAPLSYAGLRRLFARVGRSARDLTRPTAPPTWTAWRMPSRTRDSSLRSLSESPGRGSRSRRPPKSPTTPAEGLVYPIQSAGRVPIDVADREQGTSPRAVTSGRLVRGESGSRTPPGTSSRRRAPHRRQFAVRSLHERPTRYGHPVGRPSRPAESPRCTPALYTVRSSRPLVAVRDGVSNSEGVCISRRVSRSASGRPRRWR
jgi:hypothetical protein